MTFFSSEPIGIIFSQFDMMHISAILFLVSAIILVIIFRNKIANWKYEKHFRYSITILAIISETVFRIWKYFTQDGTILTVNLPLHLCSITLALCWLLMLFEVRWTFKLIYFYSIGAVISMFVGDCGGFGVNHFRYYQYFYIHGYIVFTPIYFALVHKYKITFKNLIQATGILVGIFCIVMPIDYFLGANYMYLMEKPPISSPLDFLDPWPQYILGMVIIALCAFTLFYIPWIFINRKGKNSEQDKDKEHILAA